MSPIYRVEEQAEQGINVKAGGKLVRRCVPPKRRLTFSGLHGVIPQEIVLFITTAVSTSNPAERLYTHVYELED
jgi:hypothetical protein